MGYLKRKWEEKTLFQKRVSILIYIATGLMIILFILGLVGPITLSTANLIIVLMIGLVELLLGLHYFRDSKPATIVCFIAGIWICYLGVTGLINTIS